MADKYLTKRQTFYIAEFNEEAAWLSFMHREGWKLVKAGAMKYRFEACNPEDWVYQLDFRREEVAEEEYIQLYADYGWEYVTRFRRWYYFRKIRTAGDDMSIFSDNQSKIDMCQSVIRHHARLLAALYLFYLVFYIFMRLGSGFAAPDSFFSGFFNGASIGILIGGFLGLCFMGNQLQRLRRKIKQLENPIQ